MNEVVKILKEKKLFIATMESCTGGGIVNAITNIEGASNVLKFSAVTYSNEYKIKMGVNEDTINKYSVYSIEVAKEMSKQISEFTNADLGIGITGRINCEDPANIGGDISLIYISIYEKNKDQFHTLTLNALPKSREENKQFIIRALSKELVYVLRGKNGSI